MKKLVVVVLFLLGLWGCKTPSPTHTKSIIEKDSVYTKVNFIPRDTAVFIPGDVIELKVPIYDLKEVPITVSTSRGSLELSKINEEILAKCNIDDLQKIITLQDKLITEFQKQTKTEIEYREVPVKYIPKWIQILAGIGALAVLFLVYRIIKFFKGK